MQTCYDGCNMTPRVLLQTPFQRQDKVIGFWEEVPNLQGFSQSIARARNAQENQGSICPPVPPLRVPASIASPPSSTSGQGRVPAG